MHSFEYRFVLPTLNAAVGLDLCYADVANVSALILFLPVPSRAALAIGLNYVGSLPTFVNSWGTMMVPGVNGYLDIHLRSFDIYCRWNGI
ncbi:hypothetical protein CI15_23870 [Paraburkholderia monticola]|uniref:Uncharacterized protein n=1 Tax=Paraburkholderia monticola TaxID=1399968 RepID=A0A149PHH1_9BURK|nr:hypothetical protein CI15_23870 [Paraburkholderia monticola]